MHKTDLRPHVTVVGDLILDRYLIGDASKLNPEQPGVVIRVDREEDRLGGAAAVAMLAAGLGAHVTLASVIGRDEPGDRLRRLIDAHGIEPHLWIDDRPTTWKQRIVTRGQLRPDRCDREATTPIGDHAAKFLSTSPLGNMLLISDYGKGVCTRSLLRTLGSRVHDANIPILVDPARSRKWTDYGQVTLIKANFAEATEAVGNHSLRPLAMASGLAEEHDCHVVVTIGHHGMVCAEQDGATWYLPAELANVRDVCGAGDTVLATLGMGLARGESLRDTCKLAVMTAAEQVSQIGIAPMLNAASSVRLTRTSRSTVCP